MLNLETRKWIVDPFTTIIVSPLIQSAVGILFDSRNVAAASKPNFAHVTTVLK